MQVWLDGAFTFGDATRLQVLTVGLLALLFVGAIWGAGRKQPDDKTAESLQKRLGMQEMPAALFTGLSVIWAIVFVVLVAGLVFLIIKLLLTAAPINYEDKSDFRFLLAQFVGITAVTGAVIGLPLTMLRLKYTRTQTQTEIEGLITDRINKAVEGLGAEKVLKRNQRDSSGKSLAFEETGPNLEVRVGAIYSLERIAKDSPRDEAQIVETLTAYIRGNTKKDQSSTSPVEIWRTASKDLEFSNFDGLDFDHEIHRRTGIDPNHDLDPDALTHWALRCSPPRIDIQTAIEVIGRSFTKDYRNITKKQWRLDLSDCNLQGAVFEDGFFELTNFAGSRLDGADFSSVRLKGSDFSYGSLIGVDFDLVNLEMCTFSDVDLHGAEIVRSILEESDFSSSRMIGITIGEATMARCAFYSVDFTGAKIRATILRGTNFRSTNLKGAKLERNQLEGSYFSGTLFNDFTSFKHSDLAGSLIVNVYPNVPQLTKQQIYSIFSLKAEWREAKLDAEPPAHWATENTKADPIYDQWRAWQRSIGFDPDDPT
ncbi:pentapeptide repeat-containing protein [Nereida sp. MMG025]|uniref:pentapeptide repeat-containing protein n=1 Tax=Nereida sp. MMG025 TaxID=2909981 RepID=UPI001F2D61C6|nr:pentapeptide repeat-containing protein [Nereida sp. MMG025]MCF6445423.1 pentapeptide repeat-containing protein [Nereida sp. MMG025]